MCGGLFGRPKMPKIKQPREVQSLRAPEGSASRASIRRRVESQFMPPSTLGPSAIIARSAAAHSQPLFRGETILG